MPEPRLTGIAYVRGARSITLTLVWEAQHARPIRVVRAFADWWTERVPPETLPASLAAEFQPIIAASSVTRSLSLDTIDWNVVAAEVRRLLTEPPAQHLPEPGAGQDVGADGQARSAPGERAGQ